MFLKKKLNIWQNLGNTLKKKLNRMKKSLIIFSEKIFNKRFSLKYF